MNRMNLLKCNLGPFSTKTSFPFWGFIKLHGLDDKQKKMSKYLLKLGYILLNLLILLTDQLMTLYYHIQNGSLILQNISNTAILCTLQDNCDVCVTEEEEKGSHKGKKLGVMDFSQHCGVRYTNWMTKWKKRRHLKEKEDKSPESLISQIGKGTC